MSERYAGDVELLLNMIASPENADLEDLEEEYYQFSGGDNMPENPSREQVSLCALRVLLEYYDGWYYGHIKIEDLVKARIHESVPD